MSELTLRTIADEDDYESYMASAYSVFLRDPQKDEIEVNRKFTELDRMIGFHDGKKWVATTGAFSRHVVLPGGAVVPVAAVTAVTVSPTHRRRGLLTTMMRHQLADIRSRGESLAMLFASEALIYGRFGYGVATESAELSGQVRELAFRPTVDLGDGTLEEVSAETFLASAPAIYDAVIPGLPGQMSRTPNGGRPGLWTVRNCRRNPARSASSCTTNPTARPVVSPSTGRSQGGAMPARMPSFMCKRCWGRIRGPTPGRGDTCWIWIWSARSSITAPRCRRNCATWWLTIRLWNVL